MAEAVVVGTAAAAAQPQGVNAAFNREAVERVAAGEPEWLRELRLRAWEVYERAPLPNRKLEEWRYTDVRRLELDHVRLSSAVSASAASDAGAELEGKAAAARVVQVGNAPARIWLDPALAARGVLLLDLREAAATRPELVRPYLAIRAVPATAGKFAALSAALWQSGLLLYVPRGVRIEAPIRVLHWLDEGGEAVLPRTLLVAERESAVSLVEDYLSPDLDAPALSLSAVEAYAGEAAEVRHVALQRWGQGVRHISMQKTLAGRDARLDTLLVNLGATLARVDQVAALEGPGAQSDMLGLYFASGDQHFDMNTRQDHLVPHAGSELLYKGVLHDRSRTIFRGLLKVWPDAQRTDAFQTNRNLLLSKEAEAISLPNLEIEADDVRCSHAATVGHLDEDELFYIMSRGVPPQEAQRLVVLGFLGQVLDRLPLRELAAELRSAIERRIG